MRRWTADEVVAGRNAPHDVTRLLELLEGEASQWPGPWPKVLSIGRQDRDGDEHRYEALMELAPGLTMPSETGLVELIEEHGLPEPAPEEAALEAMEGVSAYMDGHLGPLEDVVHGARLRARRLVAGWRAEGSSERVVDVRLVPYTAWRTERRPMLLVLVEALDTRLVPAVEEVFVGSVGELEAALTRSRPRRGERERRLAELAGQGATGSIDRLALNALAAHGDVAAQLRRFAEEPIFWLADGTAMIMDDGHVHAGTGEPNQEVEFQRGRVVASPGTRGQEDLDRAAGRPANRLLAHPLLTDDILVRAARFGEDSEGGRVIVADLDQPVLLFCSTSGRHWRANP